jgi:hypothetical protein
VITEGRVPCASRAGRESHLLLPFRDMGLIDVRRFWVTTRVGGPDELEVSDIGLAEESRVPAKLFSLLRGPFG